MSHRQPIDARPKASPAIGQRSVSDQSAMSVWEPSLYV